ncbi:hypothetical protein [Natronorubrum sp. FCH18a]|uniref:hypothetical protein n=1 Tax=Natronorubrum sp. FCH18a TaxID=3447018 RepID=UPI003F519CAF
MTGWQTSTGVSDDTVQVQLYTPKSLKKDWQDEAENRDESMSSYLQELIQEARFLRQQGQLQIGDRRQVEQLQERIQELEAQQQKGDSKPQIATPDQLPSELVTPDDVRQVLTGNYTSLDQLLDTLLNQQTVQSRIKQHLEAELYSLGEQGQAAFRRGNGWKHLGGSQ